MKKTEVPVQIQSLGAITWRRFKKNKLAMAGGYLIIVAFLIALAGPLIRPDATPKANHQRLELAVKKPGFQVLQLHVRKNKVDSENSLLKGWSDGFELHEEQIPIFRHWIEGSRIFIERYTGFEVNNGAILSYELADVLYPIKGVKQINAKQIEVNTLNGEQISTDLQSMEKEVLEKHLVKHTYWLGTDKYGRDLMSRLMSGTIISFSVGFISVGISLLVGIFLGAVAAYYRGWLDQVIMWFINVVWSIPTLLLVIAITLVLGKGYWQVFVAVGLTMWVEVARVVRGQVLGVREKEFVEAARALGYGNGRIIFRHILPNVMSPVIVISAANFASAILIEAGLSFLGLGAQPPQATWGKMISEHKGFIITGDAHLAIIPGLAIMVLVLAFMLIGNGLRDALDTKSILTAKG